MSSYESNRKNLRRLRKILAYLYEDIESAERIVSDAGLDITTIRWNKTPMNCWYEILKNAEKHEKVEAVVSIALEEFEENAELQEAWRLYQADGQQTLEETKHKTNNERYKEWQITLNWKDRGKPRLREFDLANRDLSDLSLIEVDLKKANLSYTNLKNTNLSRADLCEVNLCGADLSGASLVEAKLLRANLSGAKLYNVNLSGAKLQGANLSYANLFKAYLEGADLRMAILHRARIDTTTQLHAKWRLVWEIIHQEIRHPDIREANLIKKNSFGDTITGNYLSGADLILL